MNPYQKVQQEEGREAQRRQVNEAANARPAPISARARVLVGEPVVYAADRQELLALHEQVQQRRYVFTSTTGETSPRRR